MVWFPLQNVSSLVLKTVWLLSHHIGRLLQNFVDPMLMNLFWNFRYMFIHDWLVAFIFVSTMSLDFTVLLSFPLFIKLISINQSPFAVVNKPPSFSLLINGLFTLTMQVPFLISMETSTFRTLLTRSAYRNISPVPFQKYENTWPFLLITLLH